MKRFGALVGATLFALACGGAEEAPATDDMGMDDPDIMPAGEAMPLPANWAVRLDDPSADVSGFRVSEADGGVEFETGPAGIAYDLSQMAHGDYTVSGNFTEIGAPAGHREAMGLFIGGSDLNGPNQRYSYFLVRGDGSYLIKRRNGTETMNVSDGWMKEDAVTVAQGGEDVTNALSVIRVGDLVHFAVNGTQVATLPSSEIDVEGVAGLRINHNLHVRVDDWAIEN